jgi:hypothetical protein
VTTENPTHQAILAELKKLAIDHNSKINADGSVDVNGTHTIPTSYVAIPLQFRNVYGSFWCDGYGISSLKNAPIYVSIALDCRQTNVDSLHHIHKTHKNWVIEGRLYLPVGCTHILGLAYIPGVHAVQLGEQPPITVNHDDPFLWQEQLIEMGLVEQAQL